MVWEYFRDAVSTTIGNSVVGWADRQARQRRLRRPPRADLLLALLATRLAAVAYVETEADLRSALRSPAIRGNVHGGMDLLHFRQQKDEGLHPQWFLCRGSQPWWNDNGQRKTDKQELCTAALTARHDTNYWDEAVPSASQIVKPYQDALYLVFRGTWSATDVIRDLCVEPEPHGVRCSSKRLQMSLNSALCHSTATPLRKEGTTALPDICSIVCRPWL